MDTKFDLEDARSVHGQTMDLDLWLPEGMKPSEIKGFAGERAHQREMEIWMGWFVIPLVMQWRWSWARDAAVPAHDGGGRRRRMKKEGMMVSEREGMFGALTG